MRRLALPLVAVLVLAAPAGAAKKKPKPPAPPPPGQTLHRHTDADTAKARAALLTLDALGGGWRAKTPASRKAGLTCSSFLPVLNGVVETGAAVSPEFQASATGPFVGQATWVYRTAAQASTLWRRVVGPGLERCFADSVAQGSTRSVLFEVKRRSALGLPRLEARAAGWRVTATAVSAGQKVTAYTDLIVLSRGRTVSELTIAQFASPMPRAREVALAGLAAARL